MVLSGDMLFTKCKRGHVSSLINVSEAIAIQTAFISRSMRYDKKSHDGSKNKEMLRMYLKNGKALTNIDY